MGKRKTASPSSLSKLKTQKVSFDTDCWGTPRQLYRWLDDQYHFVADLAASDKNHLHETYFTIEDSAFNHNWYNKFGKKWVYANPPYSSTSEWMEKAVVEWRRGLSIVFLVQRPDGQRWWQDYVYGKAAKVIMITGRLKFLHPETLLPQKGCSFSSCLVIWDGDYQDLGATALEGVEIADIFNRL